MAKGSPLEITLYAKSARQQMNISTEIARKHTIFAGIVNTFTLILAPVLTT